MEILREKGKPMTIFGYEYQLTISLRTLAEIRDQFGPLEELMLNYETIPGILAIMVQDYCRKHPDAPTIDPEELKEYLDLTDIQNLQKFIQEILNPKDDKSKN